MSYYQYTTNQKELLHLISDIAVSCKFFPFCITNNFDCFVVFLASKPKL